MTIYEITNLKHDGNSFDNFVEIVEASSPYEAAQQIHLLFDGQEWNTTPQPVMSGEDANFDVREIRDVVSGAFNSISYFR